MLATHGNHMKKMAKKKIILTNWDDSHRIGVAVESFEELKFKGNQKST